MRIEKLITFLLLLVWSSIALAVDVEYEIRKGDEVMKISYIFYGTHQKWRKVLEDNPELNPKDLVVGTKITIRDAIDKDYSVIVYDYSPEKNHKEKNHKQIVKTRLTQSKKNIDSKQKTDVDKAIISEFNNYKVKSERREKELLAEIAKLKEKLRNQEKENYADADRVCLEKLDELREKNKEVVEKQVEEAQEINERWKEKLVQLQEEKNNEVKKSTEEVLEWKEKYLSVQVNFDEKEQKLINQKNEIEIKYNELKVSYDAMSRLTKDEKNWKNKYFQLQDDFVEAKEDLSTSKEDYSQLLVKYKSLKNWNSEKEELLDQLKEMKNKFSKLEKESKNQEKKNDLFVRQNIIENQEQILKEKGQILSQRLWIEKNKDLGQCSLKIVNQTPNKPKFEELEEVVKEIFGEKSFYVEPSENKLVIRLPGKTVYGVDNPRIQVVYQKLLTKIGNYLKDFSIKKVEFFGHSRYNRLKTESGAVVDREVFELKQALQLKNYMTQFLNFSEEKVLAGTGHFVLPENKSTKYFDMAITFKEPIVFSQNRKPTMIKKPNEQLLKITENIYEKLQEPKYGRTFLDNQEFEIHLGRHYFFDNTQSLRASGKDKLNKVLDIFSLSSDVGLEIVWVPGRLENDKKKIAEESIKQINEIRNYISKSGKWPTNKINYKVADKYQVIKEAFNDYEDKINRRIILRVVPLSVSMRYISTAKL